MPALESARLAGQLDGLPPLEGALAGAIVGISLCLGSQSALRGAADGSATALGQPCRCAGRRGPVSLGAALASGAPEDAPELGVEFGAALAIGGAGRAGDASEGAEGGAALGEEGK